MNLSLRMRVLLLVFAVNALVFGAGVFFVYRVQVDEKERLDRERAEDLLSTLRVAIRPGDSVNVVSVLRWPHWSSLEDAFLAQKVERRPRGALIADGLTLNPSGGARRSQLFDEQVLLGAMLRSIRTASTASSLVAAAALPSQVGSSTDDFASPPASTTTSTRTTPRTRCGR